MIEAAPALGWTLGGIYMTLVTATGIAGTVRRVRPASGIDQIVTRIRSWWLMTIVFTIVLLVHPALSIAFFALISLLAFREFTRMQQRTLPRAGLGVAYLGIVGHYLVVSAGTYGMFVLFIGLYVFLAVPALGAIRGRAIDFTATTGTLLFGLFVTTFAVSHAPMLLQMPAAQQAPAGAPGLLVYLVVITEANDVAQFLWGRAIGKRPVSSISPNKTVEGLLGGIVSSAVLGAALALPLTPFPVSVGAAVGGAIGMAGFLGDITMSAVKRDAGAKDFGRLLPGHGGVLDRIDSLIVTAPLFFHFFRYFYG